MKQLVTVHAQPDMAPAICCEAAFPFKWCEDSVTPDSWCDLLE